MALLKPWTVLLSVACIVLLIVEVYRCGRPSAAYDSMTTHKDESGSETRQTHSLEPPDENQSDRKPQHTHSPVPLSQENQKSNETQPLPEDNESQQTNNPVPLPEDHKYSETQINATDAIHRRLVVLTAFSSNHFREAQDMIGSVQKYLPHAKILIYDIGLSTEQREAVSKSCNVELKTFNFAKYPPHVKTNLYSCAWKPLILQELVDQGYDIILYGDTSLRMTTHNITPALQYLLDFPFLSLNPDYLSMISLTHDKMIKYLQFPPSRQYMAHWETVQGGCWLLLVNDVMREKLIAPWVDCALHEECIAPDGARRGGCKFSLNARNDGTYVGCHRYDQSALNIILAKNFGLKVWDKVAKEEVGGQLTAIVRQGARDKVQGAYPVKHNPHCNNTEVSV